MFKRGGIYAVNLAHDGEAPRETCPSLVVSNNISNEFSPVVTIIPLLFTERQQVYEFETPLPAAMTGLDRDARVSSHIILTIDKTRVVGERLGFVSKVVLEQVEKALRLQLSL
jgi:mRNA interferase MazF